ncbi:MAG: hypothetical protein ACLRPZ_04250 [Coprococcus sp.]
MAIFEPLVSSITVDISRPNCDKMLVVKQNDINSRKFSIKLTTNGIEYKIPQGTTAKYAIERSYNSCIWNDCEEIKDNTIFAMFSSESMSIAGIFQMHIELYNSDNSKKYSTYNFLLKVLPSARNADNQVGKNEYGVLDNLIKKATETENKTSESLSKMETLKTVLENSESIRVQNENNRIDAERNRENNANEAIENCNNATTNSTNATDRANSATNNANDATKRANEAADRCDSVIDKTGLVLKTDKGVANGVAELDSNSKIPSKNINTTFTEKNTKQQLLSGENFNDILGKISKWFKDLKPSAFCDIANNLTTSETGYVLDARQGQSLEYKKLDKNKVVNSFDLAKTGTVIDGKVVSDKVKEIESSINSIPTIRSGKEMIDDSVGKDGDIFILITEEVV